MTKPKFQRWKIILLTVLIGQFFACREDFDPSLDTPSINYLVVEGFINTTGISTIQLTRTQKLAEASTIKNEVKASVQIESDNNLIAGLTESGPGIYKTGALNLPADRKYRLRIKTTAGKEYLSEFTPVKATPKLTLTWDQSSEGVTIYASTSDPNNQTRFYKYDFEETWELRSKHLSLYVAVVNPANGNIGVEERLPLNDQVNALICWKSGLSNNIKTISTKNLSQDVVNKLPVMFIPNGSEKLEVRYSILVKQYALTSEAFDFFEQMKKNTELLGSVFDPLPSTVVGNIKCVTDPSEPVVGNIVSASAEETRIFIDKKEAGNWEAVLPCGIEYAANGQANLNLYFRNDRFLIIDQDLDDTKNPPVVRGYFISNPQCLDCRKRGGNNIRPSYW